MLRHLFPGLTRDRERGAALMGAVVRLARDPHWYVEGEVPDSLDGRFRMLATVTALVMVRLESFGEAGDSVSVGLTEQFADLMEAEHRELGLGDPGLGKTVRTLVGALARRVSLWRKAVEGAEWSTGARDSVYEQEPRSSALAHTAAALEALWKRLGGLDVGALDRGEVQ